MVTFVQKTFFKLLRYFTIFLYVLFFLNRYTRFNFKM